MGAALWAATEPVLNLSLDGAKTPRLWQSLGGGEIVARRFLWKGHYAVTDFVLGVDVALAGSRLGA